MSESENTTRAGSAEAGAPPLPAEAAGPGGPPAPGGPPGLGGAGKTARNRRKRRKIIKNTVGAAIALLVLGGIAYGMYRLFFIEAPVHYATEFIYTGMLETSVSGWGNIRPVESSDIAVQSRGRVLETFFAAGDMVQEGDLLFTMDSEALDAEIAEIQKKIDGLTDDLTEILGDRQELMNNLELKAPFAGQLIDAENLKAGDTVTVGTKAGTLVDNRTFTLSLYFSYAYEDVIHTGMTARVSVPAYMSVVEGTVVQINKVRRVSPEGVMTFEVLIDVPNPGSLADGMAAGASLRAGGEEIFPSEAGELAYKRSEDLILKAPGVIQTVNLVNFLDYRAGETLCRIEYKQDNAEADAIEKQIQDLEKEIETKREGYKNLQVTAPIGGTVMYNNLIPGENAEPGLAVISIAQLEKMMVEAQVDERDVGKVQPGMPVEITVWGPNGQSSMTGTVKSVSMQAGTDPSGMMSGYFPAVFEIDNYGGALMSGMGVDYRLIVEQKMDILVAPVIAVKNTEQGTCVFVKADAPPESALTLEGNIVPPGFYAVPVTCGIGNENGIEIISGVADGAEVFTQITPYDENDPNASGGRGGGMVVSYG
ncbi:MAG: HlyD family efflux transporter periplasmic adaptor subunit [Oscillospiraceae bacterium]|nr:HlyD family efflux transporter periplasmic adaptor subunit [Oscillospiraceae bacterium]